MSQLLFVIVQVAHCTSQLMLLFEFLTVVSILQVIRLEDQFNLKDFARQILSLQMVATNRMEYESKLILGGLNHWIF